MQHWPAMSRRAFLRAGMGVGGALALAACGKSSPGSAAGSGSAGACSPTQVCSRPTLRTASGQIGGFPSPFSYFAAPGYGLMAYVYDTLLWIDGAGRFLPWLASRWQRSADGLTYNFELRDVRWHDGRPLTPDDVIFTFDYYTAHAPTLGMANIGVPDSPVKVTATGPRSVEIVLPTPVVNFATDTAATLPIVPRHIWAPIADPAKVHDLGALVGTGPYRLTSYSNAESTYLYEADDSFFLGRPFVKRLEMHPVADELNSVLAGELDAGSSSPSGVRPDALAPFRSNPSFGIDPTRAAYTQSLHWNLAKGGALADVRFRRACAMAINRSDMVARLLGGDGVVGNPGYLVPGNPWYVPVDPQYAYPFDLAGAGRVLDQAGYPAHGPGGARVGPDGKPLAFSLLVNNQIPATGELVVSYLDALGIKVSAESADMPTLITRLPKGQFDMALSPAGSPTGEPDVLRLNFASTVPDTFRSTQGYVNPTFDALAGRQLVTLDPTVRHQIVDQMQQIVARDIPQLALYYANSYLVFDKSVFDQWHNVPFGVEGGPSYASDKEAFVFGVTTGETVRPER